MYIHDGTVSAASDTAIYNSGSDGRLVLAGSPSITGCIAGFGAGRVSVVADAGADVFVPESKKYLLAPDSLLDGDIVVVGGAGFMENFDLADAGFALVVRGNDLVAHNIFGTPAALDVVYSEGLTLASLALPAGYAWVSPGTVLSAGANQEFDAVYTDPSGSYGSVQGKIVVNIAAPISVVSADRVIPLVFESRGEAPDVFSVDVAPDGFSAGPVPVGRRQAGRVSFFWEGRGIEGGTLYVYGSAGNLVKKVHISDRNSGNLGRRKVGEWDLTGFSGRLVPGGSYVVRGTITARDGKKKKVSVVLGVR